MIDSERRTSETATALRYVSMESEPGRRISVIGGGGKSTLSKAIAAKTGLTYIEMDAIHHKPNWVESTPDELRAGMEAAIAAAPDGWVADGHYWSKIGDLVLRQADMVIWLDLPWRVMFRRMFLRSIQRAWDKEKICGDNTESWRQFFSRKSLWWYWITNRRLIINRGQRMVGLLPAGVPVIRLRSARELNRFYEVHGLTRLK